MKTWTEHAATSFNKIYKSKLKLMKKSRAELEMLLRTAILEQSDLKVDLDLTDLDEGIEGASN